MSANLVRKSLGRGVNREMTGKPIERLKVDYRPRQRLQEQEEGAIQTTYYYYYYYTRSLSLNHRFSYVTCCRIKLQRFLPLIISSPFVMPSRFFAKSIYILTSDFDLRQESTRIYIYIYYKSRTR